MSYILGIWDGHDSGAALLKESEIVAAVNEERFTRRKLDVCFPLRSIEACLNLAGIKKEEVRVIAVSTYDLAKTLTRFFPGLKENYYQVRRRKKYVPYIHLQKKMKFLVTGIGPSWFSRKLSQLKLTRYLRQIGFRDFDFFLVDHHAAHAACAAYCAPFDKSTVITVDGVGDGLSATISTYENNNLSRIAEISALNSLGLFFEQVTFLLSMRELEDEGKVMSLADLANPEPENPMLDFFAISGLSIKARYSPLAMFSKLQELAFKLPWEKFAWMAQKTLEAKMLELFQNAIGFTRIPYVAWGGGIAANVKANQKIRLFSGLKNWFVFPHMGDGGLALGAALWARAACGLKNRIPFSHVYLGNDFSEEEMLQAIQSRNVSFQQVERIEEKAALLLAEGNILLWHQGRMEYGPRALGNRSILAPADDLKAKESLNGVLKRRSWFQPFCPTILLEDASSVLGDADGISSPFMTMAYEVKPEKTQALSAVIATDASCRPQLLEGENPLYRNLLEHYKKLTGSGFLLNTSFNRHGEPLVSTPLEALSVFLEAGFPYLIMNHFLLENPEPKIGKKKTKVFALRNDCAH